MTARSCLRRIGATGTTVALTATLLTGLATPALAAVPALRIVDASVTETQSAVVKAITITRGAPTTTAASVKVKTAPGTAVTPADFATLPLTTVSFAAGQTSRTINVTVAGDALDENNETFTVLLSSPVGATIADGSATVVIVDNDATPTVRVPTQTVNEGSLGLADKNVTAVLSAPSGRAVSASWSTSGGTAVSGDDFEPATGTVSFAPGATTAPIAVSIDGDTVDEPVAERFYVQLSAPVNATIPFSSYGRVVIADDDSPLAPTLYAFAPAVGSSPSVVLKGSAVDGTSVQVFTAGCPGTPVRVVAPGDLAAGVALTAADNAATTFTARTVNTAGELSACSNAVTYTHDDLAPRAPTGAFFAVGNPANNNNPVVTGSTDAGTLVRLYLDACASSPIAKVTAPIFGESGVGTAVSDNSSTAMWIDAVDAAGNRSVCTPVGTYVEDSIAPAPITDLSVLGGDPDFNGGFSGVGSRPKLTGTSEAGGSVRIFAFNGGDCGALLGTFSSAQMLTGARVTFPVRATTAVLGVPVDQAGNVGSCFEAIPVSYTEISTETEPNGTSASANPGQSGVGQSDQLGEIASLTDSDFFTVVVPAGATVRAETLQALAGPTCASNELDSLVRIYSFAGAVLTSNDDGGAGFCSLATIAGLAAGTYFVEVLPSSFGGSSPFPLSYTLRLAVTVPVTTTTPESEPNGTAATANALGAFTTSTFRDGTGALNPAGDLDYFSFTAPGGTPITVETVNGATSNCAANTADTFLTVFAADGTTVVATNDDAGVGFCSQIVLANPAAGTYFVQVKVSPLVGGGPTTFDYRLTLR